MTVDGNGVLNIAVPLLAFKGIAKTADKNSFDGIQNFISQGGNNPYRPNNGGSATVNLQQPERVLVYFEQWLPGSNTSRKFISDGIRL